jgi:hypothetical protein
MTNTKILKYIKKLEYKVIIVNNLEELGKAVE